MFSCTPLKKNTYLKKYYVYYIVNKFFVRILFYVMLFKQPFEIFLKANGWRACLNRKF